MSTENQAEEKKYLTKEEVEALSKKKNLTFIEIGQLCEARLFYEEDIEQRVTWPQLKKAMLKGYLPARKVQDGKGRRGGYTCQTEAVLQFYKTRIVPQPVVVPQKCG